MKADVVIIGAGLAGLVAGIEARSHDTSVLLLDKLPPPNAWNAVSLLPGGIGNDTFRSNGGGLARYAADVLVEHLRDGSGGAEGDGTSVDVLLQRHRELGWGAVNTDLLRTYLTRVFEDCCWLRDEVGLPYDETGRTVKGRGIGLLRFLHEAASSRGVQMLFNTRVDQLLKDETGCVHALRATRDGESFEIEASAIILATGGFQGNGEMLMEHVEPTVATNVQTVGSPDNTGDGHLMAKALGARMRHLGVVHIRTTDKFFGQGPSRFLAHIYPMGVYFNERYERFVDEGVADSDTIANAIAYQPGSKAGLIFDDKARARYPKEYERYPRREQLIKVAGSLDELAARLHLEAAPLKKMISEFNASLRDGKISGPNVPKTASACPIDTPPFYGFYPVRPALNHTLGGLDVNSSDCRVLDEAGQPIPGLYAAGTVVNWAFGKPYKVGAVTTYRGSYHAGASSGAGIALVLGRLAGRAAALAKKAEKRVSVRGRLPPP